MRGGHRSRVSGSTWAGSLCMGWEEGSHKESEQHTTEKCDHWMKICWLKKEVGQACLFVFFSFSKPCSYLLIHDNEGAVNISKMQNSLQNINKQAMESHCRQTNRSKRTGSGRRCRLLTMNYLSQRTPYWACGLWRIVAALGWKPPVWPDSQGSRRRRERRRRARKRWRRRKS